MSKNIRDHLRKALDEVVQAEKSRVKEVLDNADASTNECVHKMKPLMELLSELKLEVGEVPGLDIDIAGLGHMASVDADTSVTHDSFCISTNSDNSKFQIEVLSTSSVDDSIYEDEVLFDTIEEVMDKVIELVGKHIGGAEAQSERKNA